MIQSVGAILARNGRKRIFDCGGPELLSDGVGEIAQLEAQLAGIGEQFREFESGLVPRIPVRRESQFVEGLGFGVAALLLEVERQVCQKRSGGLRSEKTILLEQRIALAE